MKHIISLGAGVQSSTMALMAAHGEITPMPDAAIFADTQAEPQEVYDWLDWLEQQLPFPVHRVTAGSLTERQLQPIRTSKKSGDKWMNILIPMFTSAGGIMGRKCTANHKIAPLRKKSRQLAGIHGKQCSDLMVIQWLGISLDEIQRMKVSVEPWQEFRHPLIEQRMTRADCFTWMKRNGYPEPPRSACTYCPFHSNEEWKRIKAMPDEWAAVVQFEKDIQALADQLTGPNRLKGTPFLHNSCVPIGDVDLNAGDNQFDWVDECEGMCGL